VPGGHNVIIHKTSEKKKSAVAYADARVYTCVNLQLFANGGLYTRIQAISV